MEAAQIRLGLIGYGEIGSTLGRGLRRSGLTNIAAYDKGAFAGPFSDLIRHRAQEAGVALVGSPVELAGCADVILGVTPGSASLESASAFAPHINSTHIFVDVASATPKVKQAVADRLRASGAVIGDASIVGTPRDGHAMPILASGPGAEPMRDALTPWGMRIEPVGPEIGSASGIKILRSVVTKGLEALLVECILGARRYGVNDVVLASLGKALASVRGDRRRVADHRRDPRRTPRGRGGDVRRGVGRCRHRAADDAGDRGEARLGRGPRSQGASRGRGAGQLERRDRRDRDGVARTNKG